MSEQAPLLRVCSLLNKHHAKYLIVGARACWLHGYVRATMDVDILIPEDLVENIVVKIADEVEVDVSTRAWKVTYADAIRTSLKATIEGVEVPYVDLQTLIKSKSTERDQDKVDVKRLLSLNRPK